MSRDVFQSEIRTRDLRRAVPFYRAVFDWRVYPAAEDYALVDTGALPIVSILQTSSPLYPLGVATNLLVDDCEKAAAQAVALGGRISVPKSEVPSSGLFIGAVDPWGTELFFWQAYTDAKPKPQGSGQNPISYLEISAPNLAAATKYYAELTGWSFASVVFMSGLAMARGCGLKRGVGLIEGRPGALTYVEVRDLADTVARVQAAGGKLLAAPADFPGEGRYIIFEDLDGVRMGAIEGASAGSGA